MLNVLGRSALVSLPTELRDDGGASVPSLRVCYVCLDSPAIGLLMHLALLEYCVVSVRFLDGDDAGRIPRDVTERPLFSNF